MKLERNPSWRPEEEYGGLNYQGATVLDIGAEYGVTAEFFLERGAARVFVSEIDTDLLPRLKAWAADKPVTVVPALELDTAVELLYQAKPDLVKVDCEGAEALLLLVPFALLAKPRGWVMETHSEGLYFAWLHVFKRLRYRVSVVRRWPRNPPERHRAVIQAVRP